VRSGFAGKCVPVASVSGWQAESQKRQLSVRDREDFRCNRSTAAQENYHTCEGQGRTSGATGPQLHRKITIHVRDREDFRCSRSTAARKITILVRDREDFRCSRSTAARKITIHVRDREDFRCSRSTAARKITIHVRDRGGLQVQQVHSCTGNYRKCGGQGGLGSVSNETII
jgi:hypothetical protein